MKLLIRIVTHLTFYVVLGLIAGVVTGHYFPGQAVKLEFLGTGFISLIRLLTGPVIFLTIVPGIGAMGDLKRVGRIGFKSLLYFEVVTTFSLALGVAMALVFRPGDMEKTALASGDASRFTQKASAGFDWVAFFQTNITLQILMVSLAAGIGLTFFRNRKQVVTRLERAASFVFRLLRYVMLLAPLGAFGGMAFTVGKFGLAGILPLAQLVGCMYLTMALFVLLVLGGILRYYRLSILRFLAYIEEEILIVLGTSSSETALPGLMYKLEKLGCPGPVVGLVVPAGYSFNLDGTSIYLSMAAIFLAQLYGIQLSTGELGLLTGVLMLTSKGAAGVSGSGFIVLASTLESLHTIPVAGLAFLVGVDKFMSEARAVTNLIGNGVACLFVARSEGGTDRQALDRIGIRKRKPEKTDS